MVARKTAAGDRQPEFRTVTHGFLTNTRGNENLYAFIVIAHILEQIVEEFEQSRFQARIY